MVKLVSILGTSPGGIFETFSNLLTGNYSSESGKGTPVEIREVYIIRTNHPQVTNAWNLLKNIFLCCGVSEHSLSDIVLDMDDIKSPEDYVKFRKEVLGRLNPGDYVDFTGGRKAMSAAAAIAAIKAGAHLVTTVIEQSDYNRIQELIKAAPSGSTSTLSDRGQCGSVKNYLCSLISKQSKTILLQ
jgi:hypothetical protein